MEKTLYEGIGAVLHLCGQRGGGGGCRPLTGCRLGRGYYISTADSDKEDALQCVLQQRKVKRDRVELGTA
jgi:hypothetical protein